MNAEFNSKIGEKKRILIVITQSEFGGAQRFIFNFVNKLRTNVNYDIKVCVGIDGGGEFTKAIQEIGVPIVTISSLRRNLSFIGDIGGYFILRREIKGRFSGSVFFYFPISRLWRESHLQDWRMDI